MGRRDDFIKMYNKQTQMTTIEGGRILFTHCNGVYKEFLMVGQQVLGGNGKNAVEIVRSVRSSYLWYFLDSKAPPFPTAWMFLNVRLISREMVSFFFLS